jgi:hypothetical protein
VPYLDGFPRDEEVVSRPSPFRADKVFAGLDNARRIRTGHGFFEALIERALLR